MKHRSRTLERERESHNDGRPPTAPHWSNRPDRKPVAVGRARCMLRGMADVTQILEAIEAGDSHAAAELLPLVYDELRKLTGDQAAAVLGLSPSSVDRLWVYTRVWLRREFGLGVES